METGLIAELLQGVCACGYWSCFDEFNRINANVLAVISQLFVKIQTTKQRSRNSRRGLKEIELDGKIVPF
jgi:hypothetical protein